MTIRGGLLRLKDKTALVTGAGRGIGRGIAEVLADQGANVAINYLDNPEEAARVADYVRSKGGRATAVKADVARRVEVEPMIEKVWSELGPIDILVNNAGIETIVPFLELTDEQWTRLTDTNLRGGWLCSQVLCRRVVAEKRQASIVNIGSIQAAKVLPGRTHYAPTKLGLEALTLNIGVAAPMAYFPFSGWKDSFLGVLHGQGRDAIEFYTDKKVVVERWPKEWSRKF
jgi:NAD(P)-dependent dehydrogenase (short-subunit alcohol dehydrogenase family)